MCCVQLVGSTIVRNRWVSSRSKLILSALLWPSIDHTPRERETRDSAVFTNHLDSRFLTIAAAPAMVDNLCFFFDHVNARSQDHKEESNCCFCLTSSIRHIVTPSRFIIHKILFNVQNNTFWFHLGDADKYFSHKVHRWSVNSSIS